MKIRAEVPPDARPRRRQRQGSIRHRAHNVRAPGIFLRSGARPTGQPRAIFRCAANRAAQVGISVLAEVLKVRAAQAGGSTSSRPFWRPRARLAAAGHRDGRSAISMPFSAKAFSSCRRRGAGSRTARPASSSSGGGSRWRSRRTLDPLHLQGLDDVRRQLRSACSSFPISLMIFFTLSRIGLVGDADAELVDHPVASDVLDRARPPNGMGYKEPR